ncbi:MAG: hypothetical protein A2Z17_01390, partial [Gammaproteobacteria bacterium RBG_16_66_13]
TLTLGTRITTIEESSRPQFLQTICERLGANARALHPTTPAAADKALAQALEVGLPAIAWLDLSGPPYAFPQTADYLTNVVFRITPDEVYVAGRSRRGLALSREAFAQARQSMGVPKARLLVVEPPPRMASLAPAVRQGIRDSLRQMKEGVDIGKFRGNFGLQALLKWADLLTDPRDPKGWPRFFPRGRDLLNALVAVFSQIELRGRGGGAFRGLYADFLVESAGWLKKPALAEVADTYRKAARAWSALAEAALPDSDSGLGTLRGIIREREDALQKDGRDGLERARALVPKERALRRKLETSFPLDAAAVGDLLADLGRRVRSIHEIEREAVTALGRIVG